MVELFLKILNMSISASWIVLAVIVIRFFLKKTPKWICCILWAIVALRLIMPFPVESGLSLIPSGEVFPRDIVTSQTPEIHSGIPAVNSKVNTMLAERAAREENALTGIFSAASVVWLTGVAVMLLYNAVSYFLLRRQVKASILYRKNIYICDDVQSPFILGIFSPKIYIPSGMDETRLQYVLAHENAHIRRRDHWWKPIGFALLALYWFNPLLWVAYILLSRDIEQACDEKVIAGMDIAEKKSYSQALVECSVHRRLIMICPVAFGEVGIKARVKGVLNYKKPAFWLVLGSVAVCAVMAVCFLTDPEACPHLYHGRITVAATCTQEGVETKTCSLCRHSYTVPVKVCAHAYGEEAVVKPATCTEQGVKKLTCTGCHATKTEVIEKTAHTPGELAVTKAPTCAEDGEGVLTCTVCQAVCAVEVLEANHSHDLQETVVRKATCTASGQGLRTCTRCAYSETVTYGLIDHDFEHFRTDRSTCIHYGEEVLVCTRCYAVETVRLTELGEHSWTCDPGSVDVCRHCGKRRANEQPGPFDGYNKNGRNLLESSCIGNKPAIPCLPVVRIFP